jgi:hypothetical protein
VDFPSLGFAKLTRLSPSPCASPRQARQTGVHYQDASGAEEERGPWDGRRVPPRLPRRGRSLGRQVVGFGSEREGFVTR